MPARIEARSLLRLATSVLDAAETARLAGRHGREADPVALEAAAVMAADLDRRLTALVDDGYPESDDDVVRDIEERLEGVERIVRSLRVPSVVGAGRG